MLLLLPVAAFANGLTTHVTISQDALPSLPEGDLAELLRDPELWFYLQNGTQFPDGGYAMGEAYSETAHWEPFQDLYFDWIKATYAGNYSSIEARQHIAYLFGLSSHGMGDQVFDSLYMQRAYVYDAASDWDNTSMDQATDVAIGAATGGQQTLEPYVPTDVFVPLMAEAGVTVDAETLEDGQFLTAVAITFGREAGSRPDQQELYRAQFPWAYDHMMDEGVDGAPYWESMVVARYWQVRWALLHDETSAFEPVMFTFPQDGDYAHPTDATSPESRVTVFFSRGLVADLLQPDFFEVNDAAGNEIALNEPWVFYGVSSHAVHLSPVEDWPADTDFTVTIHAGVPFIDGTTSLVESTFSFSTKPEPAAGNPEAPECGCASAGSPWSRLAFGAAAVFVVGRCRRPGRGLAGSPPAKAARLAARLPIAAEIR